jgi:hypothetical protein
MPSTPPDIGQPTRGARTGREDRGERGNKWWTLVAVCLGTFLLATGVRLMVISGGILVTSTAAGRLTSRVPIRLLIGPGLIIVGIGLLLTRGLDAGSAWTHLIPGMIVGAAFTTDLNRILLVAAIIAFVAGVVSLAAIRSRDFSG